MPRLFTGLEIPEHICAHLSVVRAHLNGARWISPQNYHVTLRFIGDVDDKTANEFAYALDSIVVETFQLKVSGLGSFGTRQPRSLWAGVERNDNLLALQHAHEQAARYIGLSPEGRNYSPHVTLARLKRADARDVARFLDHFADFTCQPFEVSRFVLYSSRPHRGGGPYEIEASYPLEERCEFDYESKI